MKNDLLGLLALFGLDRDEVEAVDSITPEEGYAEVLVELRHNDPPCPKCGEGNPYRFGYRTVRINNSITNNMRMTAVIRVPRYRCRKCKACHSEGFSLFERGARISRPVESSIRDDLRKTLSYSEIAREYGVSVTEVVRIMDSIKDPGRLPLPRVLCVDEFHFSSGRKSLAGDYPFAMSNPMDGTIVDIVRSRRKDYLEDYFSKIDAKERGKVEVFVSDMNETYRQIRRKFFPNAVHVVDHFHVMKLFSEAIMMVRKRAMKAEESHSNEAEYRLLKGHWRLFQKDRESLKRMKREDKSNGVVHSAWETVSAALARYPELKEAFDEKQEFFEFSRKRKGPDDAKSWIPFLAQRMTHSLVPELQSVGKAFSSWSEQIINAYTPDAEGRYYSNAIAEANNNSIQTLMDLGYGYRNFDRFRKRVLLINRSREAKEERRKAIEKRLARQKENKKK